ncbi:MAG: energy-coupling factor transporter transmembrane component T [Candidatus Altiarchaeota archaeon]
MNTTNWILWLALAMTYCILTYNPTYQLMLLLTLSAVAAAKKQPLKTYIQIGLLMSAIPLLVNIFFVHYGKTTLYTIPYRIHLLDVSLPTLFFAGPITAESVATGIIMSVFLLNMVIAFQTFNNAATPDAILKIMPKTLPAACLITSISLRFIPTVVRDYSSIRDAQMSRGVRINSGPLSERVGNQTNVIAPTLVTSLERAFNLSESMASRGYTGARTAYSGQVWDSRQRIITITYFLAILFAAYAKYSGVFDFWPVDGLPLPAISLLALVPLIPLLIPLVILNERS